MNDNEYAHIHYGVLKYDIVETPNRHHNNGDRHRTIF